MVSPSIFNFTAIIYLHLPHYKGEGGGDHFFNASFTQHIKSRDMGASEEKGICCLAECIILTHFSVKRSAISLNVRPVKFSCNLKDYIQTSENKLSSAMTWSVNIIRGSQKIHRH